MTEGYIISKNIKIAGNLSSPGQISLSNNQYTTTIKQPVGIINDLTINLPPTPGLHNDILTKDISSNSTYWSPNISLSSAGTGNILPVMDYGPVVSIKGIDKQGEIGIVTTTEEIILTNTSKADDIVIETIGPYVSLINKGNGRNLVLKSIKVGNFISIIDTGNDLIIANTDPSTNIILSSVGIGYSLVQYGNGPDLKMKSYYPRDTVDISEYGTFIAFENSISYASFVLALFSFENIVPPYSSLWTDIPFNLEEMNSGTSKIAYSMFNSYLCNGINAKVNVNFPIKVVVECRISHLATQYGTIRICTGSNPCVTGAEVVTHAWGNISVITPPKYYETLQIYPPSPGELFKIFEQKEVTLEPRPIIRPPGFVSAFDKYYSASQNFVSAIIELVPGDNIIRFQKRIALPYGLLISNPKDLLDGWYLPNQQMLSSQNLIDQELKICIYGSIKIREL